MGLHRLGGSGVSPLCNMGIEAGIQAQAGWKSLSGLATVPHLETKLKRMEPGMVAYTLNLRTSEPCWNCKDYGERLRERLMYFALWDRCGFGGQDTMLWPQMLPKSAYVEVLVFMLLEMDEVGP